MPKKATAEDAQIIMRLYDLRREPEMRKARAWFAGWWPANADQVVQMISAPANPQENAWFRQVLTYWDMTAALVLNGALNEDLFFAASAELWFSFAKVYPFAKAYREKSGQPDAWKQLEKMATNTKQGKNRLDSLVKRLAAMGQSR